MEKYELLPLVNLYKSTSYSAVTLFSDNSLDMIHQDSNHSEEISCAELNLYDSKLKALVCIKNIYMKH